MTDSNAVLRIIKIIEEYEANIAAWRTSAKASLLKTVTGKETIDMITDYEQRVVDLKSMLPIFALDHNTAMFQTVYDMLVEEVCSRIVDESHELMAEEWVWPENESDTGRREGFEAKDVGYVKVMPKDKRDELRAAVNFGLQPISEMLLSYQSQFIQRANPKPESSVLSIDKLKN